jgi:hypothetical protein
MVDSGKIVRLLRPRDRENILVSVNKRILFTYIEIE